VHRDLSTHRDADDIQWTAGTGRDVIGHAGMAEAPFRERLIAEARHVQRLGVRDLG